jgi:hypothetical protein
MAVNGNARIDVEIDKLTRSIENTISGDSFATIVLDFLENDRDYKRSNWRFDWKKEFAHPDRTLYKLVIKESPKVIQGLLSMSDLNDHVFVHLIENAKFNQGKGKIYSGVPGNLFAFACKRSFDLGYDGFVAFYPKTKLKEHYMKTLGALPFFHGQLVLNEIAARNLMLQYYNS